MCLFNTYGLDRHVLCRPVRDVYSPLHDLNVGSVHLANSLKVLDKLFNRHCVSSLSYERDLLDGAAATIFPHEMLIRMVLIAHVVEVLNVLLASGVERVVNSVGMHFVSP